jgi:ATP-dependent exoDNAse (exonuclease V) beta subunit
MIHDALAEIDFAEVGRCNEPAELLRDDAPARTTIEAAVGRHLAGLSSRLGEKPLREACRRQVAHLIWNGLHTPLAHAAGPLWEVPSRDRLHELEFHFLATGDSPPPEVHREEQFLTGYMDLVFRRSGRYFLVDWKTNSLPDYTGPELERSMQASDYIRQYRLYLQALDRWLKWALGPSFDSGRDFGGVYYLYLRGLNGRDANTGVYFRRPTAEDLRLENVLGDLEYSS